MNILIRNADSHDIGILQKLQTDLHQDNAAHDRYLDLNWPQDSRGLAYYTKITTDPDAVTFIAEADGLPAGYLAGGKKEIEYRTVRIAEIFSMSIAPEYRSHGIGEQLISQFRSWAKAKGYGKVYVNVYAANERGIQFYKKCGLLPIDMSLEADV